MPRLWVPVAVLLVVVVSGVAATPATHARGPGTQPASQAPSNTSADPLDLNGLSERTVALLFSRDVDDPRNDSQPVIRRLPLSDANRSFALTHDRPFERPPATAREWSTEAFADYNADAFDTDTSRYPQHADVTTRELVADAHLTLFHLQPSTIAHESGDTPTRYITADGAITGMIDYRERTPNRTVEDVDRPGIDRRVTTYEIRYSRIENVTLTVNGNRDPETRRSDVHLPRYEYDTADYGDVHQLGIQADIVVTARETTKTYRENAAAPVSTTTSTNTTRVTVADNQSVTVYDITPGNVTGYRAASPSGDEHLAVRSDQPWSSLHVPGRNTSLATRWRFVTARTPGWTRLTTASETDSRVRPAPDLPVTVHAIPTTRPPDADATRFGVAGEVTTTSPRYPARSPPETVPETIGVSAVNDSYHAHGTIAARYPNLTAPYTTTILGVVNGTNTTVASSSFTTRSIRPADLTLETRRQNESHTVVFVQVRDAATDTPISLAGGQSPSSLFDGGLPAARTPERGQVVVRTDRVRRVVRPGADGMTVALQDHGTVHAVFEPASWTVHDPAYTEARASTDALSQAAVGGVLSFIVVVLFAVLIPVWLAVKLARAAGRIIHPEDYIQ